MIYLRGKPLRAAYLGLTPVSSVWLGGRLIWQCHVSMEAGVVLALPADALLCLADGVTYTVEGAGGAIAVAAPRASPGASALKASIAAVPVTATPYMRHIAPAQAASLPGLQAQVLPVRAKTWDGAIASAGAPGQAVAGLSAPGSVAAMRQTGAGTQHSSAIAADGVTQPVTHNAAALQRAGITAGTGAHLRSGHAAGSVYDLNAVTGGGVLTAQTHAGGGVYRAGGLSAAGTRSGASGLAQPEAAAEPAGADGRLYAACAPAGAPLPELEPGQAGVLAAACTYQTPPAAAALLGDYAGVLTAKPADHPLTGSAAAAVRYAAPEPAAEAAFAASCACADALPGSAGAAQLVSAAGMLYAACMLTRVYINPDETAFDDALVPELDILDLAEIDRMLIQL